MKKTLVAMVAVLVSVTACQQNGQGGMSLNKETVGTIIGGAGGAWAGSQIGGGSGQIVATAAGTLLGAALGNQIGASLDKTDMMYYNRTSQRALETMQPGQSLPWQNPQTGVSGTITPSSYYQTDAGAYCREYTQTIKVGGRVEEGYGVACRQPDGTWKITQ